uniref:DRBM domain-containing protein n=1 Tax=Romanomermis culicivorax TaxID=13658 RepID=A0A915KTW8_ROMCU
MMRNDVSRIQKSMFDSNGTAENALNVAQRTPMSRIVELARFNKINHQYVLINESGPAHRKTFTVKLILGENEHYLGEGLSIKRAQQNAASNALEQTKFHKPIVKIPRSKSKNPYNSSSFRSPTVLLNGLLAKRNLTAKYYRCPNISDDYFYYDFDGAYSVFSPNSDGAVNLSRRKNPIHTVCLKIGSTCFYGRGRTVHMARHEAAAQAILALNLGLGELPSPEKSEYQQNPKSTVNKDPKITCDYSPDLRVTPVDEQSVIEQIESSVKGPVCIVYEIAVRSKMEVVSETGPAHEKIFVVELKLIPKFTKKSPSENCDVITPEFPTNSLLSNSDNPSCISCRGHGASKRLAKNDACLNMIKCRLAKDPKIYAECLPVLNSSRQPKPVKVKRETIVKALKMDPNYGQQINPISRLIQVQQAKREAEPKFELIEELGQGRYKEYVIQVEVNSVTCRANGPNKKLAKRTAAEMMLEKLGYNKPLPLPGKPVLKQPKEIEPVEQAENQSKHIATGCPSSSLEKRRVKFDLETQKTENFNESSFDCSDKFLPPEIPNEHWNNDNPTSGWHQVDAPRRMKCSKISSKDKLAFSQFEMTAAESTVIMPVQNCLENLNRNRSSHLNPHANFQVQNLTPKEDMVSTATQCIHDLKLSF